MSTPDLPLVVVRGRGARIVDEKGNEYIEGMAGLWCASLGFHSERLAEVARKQLSELGTYHTFNNRTNVPCATLASQIAEIAPIRDCKVFFATSGSEANESLLKLAWFYHAGRGETARRKIISRVAAFHGSSIFTAGLSGLKHMHSGFNLPAIDVLYAPRACHYRDAGPGESVSDYCNRLLRELEDLILANDPETIAAMILEPIMGAGGVMVPPPGYLREVANLLRRHGILVIADEVVSGFGRTGKWFGCETFHFQPDMISVAKGLSSGFVPISAALISPAVYEVVSDHAARLGVLGHGFTYSGHPVAAAIASETLRIYSDINAPMIAATLGRQLHDELQTALGNHPLVGEIRGTGFIAGIELVADRTTRAPFAPDLGVGALVERAARAHGIIVRNLGDVIAICPPYVIESSELSMLIRRLTSAIEQVFSNMRLAQSG